MCASVVLANLLACGDSSASSEPGDLDPKAAGGGAGSGDTSGQPVALEDFASAFAEASCAAVGPCCAGAGLTYDSEVCQTTVRQLVAAEWLSDIDGPTYDATVAGDCIAAVRASGSTCDSGTAQPTGPACLALNGAGDDEARREGEGCDASCFLSEGGGRHCYSRVTAVPEIRGNCYSGDGLFCNDDNMCESLGGTGDACTSGHGCEGNAACSGGLCGPPLAVGGDCDTAFECEPGLYCDWRDGCAELRPEGAECADPEECESGRCASGFCAASNQGAPDDKLLSLSCVH